MKAFLRYFETANKNMNPSAAELTVPLTLREARRQIQNTLKYDTSLIIETGDRFVPVFLSLIYIFFIICHAILSLKYLAYKKKKKISFFKKICQFVISFNHIFSNFQLVYWTRDEITRGS